MIPRDKADKLVQIYLYVCDMYESHLKYHCQRYSNNSKPVFTDEEILTIYLFCGSCQHYTQIKQMHSFAKDYLSDWFPGIVSYQTFNYRLNRMSGAIGKLLEHTLLSFRPSDCDDDTMIVDSMPIISACGRNRTGKVARGIATKGYCSTKNMYYYGLKLHVMGCRRKGSIPYPEHIVISSAEENDLTVFKREMATKLASKTIYADKIYRDMPFWKELESKQNVEILTPIKAVKGATEEEKQRNRAYDDLYSTSVSKIREPIESFFNWLNEKTNIQRAFRCRSTAGLIIHTIGKIAIAFIPLIFNY